MTLKTRPGARPGVKWFREDRGGYMGKLVFIVIVATVGYAWFKGWIFAPQRQQQVVAPDPVADRAARLAAERERRHAEQDAAAKNWQPNAPTAAPAKSWQSPAPARGAVVSSHDEECAKARNNVQVTSDWMRQGGSVYEKGTNKTLSENASFDAAARSRQFIEDNCRGR